MSKRIVVLFGMLSSDSGKEIWRGTCKIDQSGGSHG